MNKFFSLTSALVTLMVSGQALAHGSNEYPPFHTLVCNTANLRLYVGIDHYRASGSSGPASIHIGHYGNSYRAGGWHWQAARPNTRLDGFHFLSINSAGPIGYPPIQLTMLYHPLHGLSGGWLATNGYSGEVACKIIEGTKRQNQFSNR